MAEISSDALHCSKRNTEVDKVGLPSGVATLYRSPSRSVADMVVCTHFPAPAAPNEPENQSPNGAGATIFFPARIWQ